MLITVIAIISLIVGVFIIVKTNPYHEIVGAIGYLLTIMGLIGTMISVPIAIGENVNSELKLYEKQMEYESLCRQVEAIQNDYEDVSAVDVIDKVYDWNIDVHKDKHWAKNPWTSWFYNQEVVDSLQYIELE